MDLIFEYFPILSERLEQRAGTLSGGEAQMLGVAKKLVRLLGDPEKGAGQSAKLLIIDEPSLGLAPESIQRVLEAISRVRQSHGVSVLLIEESINLLKNWVENAFVLNRGVVIASGSISELTRNEHVAKAFAGEAAMFTSPDIDPTSNIAEFERR
jgi:branched-chain amino acid transport system ATP-binding protein